MPPVTIHLRTFRFSQQIIRTFSNGRMLDIAGGVLQRQLIRAATSIGANVVEAQNASTKREFLQYLQIALRSARETTYWLRLSLETHPGISSMTHALVAESEEISKILSTIIIHGKRNARRQAP